MSFSHCNTEILQQCDKTHLKFFKRLPSINYRKLPIPAALLNPTQETHAFHGAFCLCPRAANVWITELQRLSSMLALPEKEGTKSFGALKKEVGWQDMANRLMQVKSRRAGGYKKVTHKHRREGLGRQDCNRAWQWGERNRCRKWGNEERSRRKKERVVIQWRIRRSGHDKEIA